LYKITKSEPLNKQENVNLYCFPDIPVGDSRDGIRGSERNNGFQRMVFGKDNTRDSIQANEHRVKNREEIAEQEAYLKGFAKGEKAGIELGKKQIDPVLLNFRQALSELEKVKKQIYLKAEKETVGLALAVAKKIVCHEIVTNQEVVLDVVKKALKQVMDHEKIVIKMNPSDLRFIESADVRVTKLDDDLEDVTLQADNAIQNGGCIIETGLGQIDARIEKQIQAVEEAFKSELQQSESGG